MVMEEVSKVMEEVNNVVDSQEKLTQSMSTPKNQLRFTGEGRILKSALVSKREPIGCTYTYFRPRSNLKPKKGLFRIMVIKSYLQLLIPISICKVNEFGETETKVLEAQTSI